MDLPGHAKVLFTNVFPLAVMTTYPAEALLGRLTARTALRTVQQPGLRRGARAVSE